MFQGLVRGVRCGVWGELFPVVLQEAGECLGTAQEGLLRVGPGSGVGLRQHLQFAHVLRPFGRHLAQEGSDRLGRVGAALGIDADEAHLPAFGEAAVVGAQPLDEVEHLLGAPGPEPQAGDQARGVPGAVPHVRVQGAGGGCAGFQGESGEARLAHQEFHDPVLEVEELAGAVGGFAQADDPHVPQGGAQRFEVLVGSAGCQRAEWAGVLGQPAGDVIGHRGASPPCVRPGGASAHPYTRT